MVNIIVKVLVELTKLKISGVTRKNDCSQSDELASLLQELYIVHQKSEQIFLQPIGGAISSVITQGNSDFCRIEFESFKFLHIIQVQEIIIIYSLHPCINKRRTF